MLLHSIYYHVRACRERSACTSPQAKRCLVRSTLVDQAKQAQKVNRLMEWFWSQHACSSNLILRSGTLRTAGTSCVDASKQTLGGRRCSRFTFTYRHELEGQLKSYPSRHPASHPEAAGTMRDDGALPLHTGLQLVCPIPNHHPLSIFFLEIKIIRSLAWLL